MRPAGTARSPTSSSVNGKPTASKPARRALKGRPPIIRRRLTARAGVPARRPSRRSSGCRSGRRKRSPRPPRLRPGAALLSPRRRQRRQFSRRIWALRARSFPIFAKLELPVISTSAPPISSCRSQGSGSRQLRRPTGVPVLSAARRVSRGFEPLAGRADRRRLHGARFDAARRLERRRHPVPPRPGKGSVVPGQGGRDVLHPGVYRRQGVRLERHEENILGVAAPLDSSCPGAVAEADSNPPAQTLPRPRR